MQPVVGLRLSGDAFTQSGSPASWCHSVPLEGAVFCAQVELVSAQALNVFEQEQAVQRWITTPDFALTGRAPIACCENLEGAHKVQCILKALEFGVV